MAFPTTGTEYMIGVGVIYEVGCHWQVLWTYDLQRQWYRVYLDESLGIAPARGRTEYNAARAIRRHIRHVVQQRITAHGE